MTRLTDVHAHILWGIDDGPDKPEGMYAMLREAHEQGIGRIFATPHVCPGFEAFDAELYRARLREAQTYCRDNGWDIELLPGAEIAWTYQTVDALRRRVIPTLGDTDYVLIEFWQNISYQEAYTAVRSLVGAGYFPIIAHVERCRCFRWMPRQALRFREETGALFQMNASTLMQPHGFLETRFRNIMLRERALDAVASDAHGIPARPMNLRRAYSCLVNITDSRYAGLLTCFPDGR